METSFEDYEESDQQSSADSEDFSQWCLPVVSRPQEDIGSLVDEAVHSRSLDLSGRALVEAPGGVWALAGLCYLDLSCNSLSELPAAIGALNALEHLDVSWNRLAEIPRAVGGLRQLATLRAAYNQLAALPPEVAALPQLTCLDLSDNRLERLPPEICSSSSLTDLRLGFNAIRELPAGIHRVTSLLELTLDGNPLTFPPKSVASEGAAAVRRHLESVARQSSCCDTHIAEPDAVGSQESEHPVGSTSHFDRLAVSPGDKAGHFDEEVELARDVDWRTVGPADGPGPCSIMESLQLSDAGGELGGAATAVLERTAALLASGLVEIRSGRPLTAGGSGQAAAQATGTLPRPGSGRSARPSSARRAGTAAAAVSRPGTASSFFADTRDNGARRPRSAAWMDRAGIPAQAPRPAANGNPPDQPSCLSDGFPSLTFPLAASISKLSRHGSGRLCVCRSRHDDAVRFGAAKSDAGGSSSDENSDSIVANLLEKRNPRLAREYKDFFSANSTR